MKRAWTIVLAVVLSVSLCAQPRQFKAGVGISDISPTNFPVLVNAMFTERVATNVVDRLNARALVLDDGETRIGMCVVDSCMVPREIIDLAKSMVKDAAGIAIDHIMISATHTHSAASNREHAVAVIILSDDRLIFSVNPHMHSSNQLGQLRRGQIKEEGKSLRLEFGRERAQVKHDLRIIHGLFPCRGLPRARSGRQSGEVWAP